MRLVTATPGYSMKEFTETATTIPDGNPWIWYRLTEGSVTSQRMPWHDPASELKAVLRLTL